MLRVEAAAYADAIGAALGLAEAPAERNVAKWQVCAEVLANLGEYRPGSVPEEAAELSALRELDAGEVRAAFKRDAELAFMFGKYRDGVTLYEATNATRLLVLGHVVRTLVELREHFEPASVDQAISTVADWVAKVWRTDVPLTGDMRLWAQRAAYRIDLLPNWMRRL